MGRSKDKKPRKPWVLTEAREASLERARKGLIAARLRREAKGIYPAEFMRLTLTEAANAITEKMSGLEFREFVSAAIHRAAKRKRN